MWKTTITAPIGYTDDQISQLMTKWAEMTDAGTLSEENPPCEVESDPFLANCTTIRHFMTEDEADLWKTTIDSMGVMPEGYTYLKEEVPD